MANKLKLMDKNIYSDTLSSLISFNYMHKTMIDGAVENMGLHRSQHIMLVCIYRSETPITQKEISASLGISPAAVTATVNKLLAKGYITRTADGDDNRCNRISLTDTGREVLEKSRKGFLEIDMSVFNGFTEEEITAIGEFAERMKKNLKKYPRGDALSEN